ncbi:winged helix-turn-helix domain-containing protein [Methanobrevibacter sp.]|uniref:winged helix-turn-helix domain-containing protein n=1 Tax=Methanobrevibacter sp. TaxID=66852 RepID=UPI00388F27E9
MIKWIKEAVTIDDNVLKVYGYVLSSSYRTRAVKALQQENKTPTQIAKDSDIRISHISKVLKELKECGVVNCLNEQDRKNKIYTLTALGHEIANNLE